MRSYSKDIIGLALCLLGIYVLISLFPFVEILIIIPTLLYVISIFIKKQIVAIMINTLTLLPFIILYIGLRMPTSKSILIDSKIMYQPIDIRHPEGIRDRIEYKLNNRRIFLSDPVNGIKWLYLDKNDFLKLYPGSPFKMIAKHDTIKARFKTYKLINGDYSKASLISFEKKSNPVIEK